jgi:N-acetylmuramoyl-L-alanine amidase
MSKFKSKPTMVVIHCSATKEGQFFNADDIDRWHKARGWSGIGYHIVILLDGTVEYGRPLHTIGAHTRGINYKSFGVSYIGGVDANGKAKDTRTEAQKKSLIAVIDALKKDYEGITVHGHYEFSNKACPSFDVSKEF